MRRLPLFRIPVLFALAVVPAVLLPAALPAVESEPAPLGREAGQDAPLPRVVDAARAPAGTEQARQAYAEALVGEARRRRLHEEPYWHTLVHYKRTLAGRRRSLVDDPKFFVAPTGQHDAQAELEATLRAFFQPDAPPAKHPLCRFVARYSWLKERLGLDPAQLAVRECEDFTRLIAEIKPESTTLVFPTSHMNNPASMFGHTLLTFETASKNRVLAYAVNYSAVTTETFGPLFAVKGLFGFYKGYFSVLPYYAKLQEYSDIDHRDMWEYRLNLTREETIRAIMHVYEMDGIYSDYYFFDENCSFNLLFLLDVARPSLHLTDETRPWVIPLDTIRAVEAAGLVTAAVYRPSKTTTIEHLAASLGRPSRIRAREMAEGKRGPGGAVDARLPRSEAARTYDLAVEYLQYLYFKKQLERPAYTERFLALLGARSALGAQGGAGVAPPPPPRPEDGHLSQRLQVGFGVKQEAFQEVRFRFAYHTLGDYPRAYPEGSQIVFWDTALRYYFVDKQLKLQQLDAVDIVSLAPRDELFAPISWKVKAGLTQRVMRDGTDHLMFQLSPGAGLAYRLPWLGLCYAMLELDATAGDALRENYALGAGGSLGVVRGITDRWSAWASARAVYYGVGDRYGLVDVALSQNYALTRNVALSLDLSRSKTREFYRTEGKLAVNLFF